MKHSFIKIVIATMGMLLSAYTNANERINGIDYVILSSTDRTAAVSENISASGNVTIPSKITISGVTYNVVLIADCAFEFSTDISSITIPNSVTSIGNLAFSGCRNLSSLTIPNSVTSIGNLAFSGCRNLSSLTIPNSVTAIGPYAFYGCDGLTSIKVQSGNSKYDSRDNCNAIIETASNKLVAGCKNTIIPNSVTSIGAYAFGAYSSLTSINIPYSVTSIGDCSFYGCSGLTSVTIPNSVTSIGNQAFSGCTNLSSVISEIEKPLYISDGSYNPFYSVSPTCTLTVPSGTKDAYIAGGWTEDVFKGGIIEAPSPNITFADANVKSLCVANWDTNGDGELSEAEAAAVTSIGNVFNKKGNITSFDEFKYFTSVTIIGENAFERCTALTSVSIPNSVKSIGESAFVSCGGLKSITIPNSVTSIGHRAFAYCKNLATITVDEGNIIYDSRDNCNAIIVTSTNTLILGCKKTKIPDNVTIIGESAFFGMSLNSIIIPQNVTTIGPSAFDGCLYMSSSITIPANVTNIGVGAFGGNHGLLQYITVESGNTKYDSRNNCNAIIETASNTLITGSENTVIPNSVTSIGDMAYYYSLGLVPITIPNSVINIGYAAFFGCSCKSITIPNSVKTIGDMAFFYCSDLNSVVSEIEEPFAFGSGAFSEISSSCTLTIPAGTKDAYIAAGWTEDVFKGGIIEAAPDPLLLNTLAISDAEVCKGRQITLPVNMNNTENITAIQFDLTLPAGVSIAKNVKGKYIVEKTGRCADHTLNVSKPGDANVYKVLLYITPVENITGSEGAVLNVTLETSESMAEGEYDVTISNINLTTPDETKITPADVTCKLTVNNSIPGDANGDGSIDVTDIVSIANAILGRPSSSFDAAAADVNGDSSVDVTDIVVVANIILNQQSGVKARNDNPQREMDPREALIPD